MPISVPAERPLPQRIARWPLSGDRARAEAALAELAERAAGDARAAEGLEPWLSSAAGRALLAGSLANSPYLARLAAQEVVFLGRLATAPPEQALTEVVDAVVRLGQSGLPASEAMAPLREAKRRIALLTALADLAGTWPLESVTGALSRLADAAVQAAVRLLLAEAGRRGVFARREAETAEQGSGLIVLGMGKLGAFELNYSSDIDICIFFDGERAPVSERGGAQAFFIRLTQALVKLLQEFTPQGYVFRTDLRLRPDPGATPAAVAIAAAEQYYESMGQNWERAAMIKARPIAGDLALGHDFLARLHPFIWRKNLDFAAIADVQSIKRQIESHKGHSQVAVAGHNLKLGRGGIRDIEFFVQTQQLIAGGRDARLRARATLPALHSLAAAGWITGQVTAELDEAYRFHRQLEHRLQMQADEQTHSLPNDPGKLAQFAAFAGFADIGAFQSAVVKQLETVARHYAALFQRGQPLGHDGSLSFTGTEDDPATIATLSGMGFRQASELAATVRGWHHGRYRAMRSARARELLTELTPALLQALAGTAEPDAAFVRFDRFLAGLPAGVQLFSLLQAEPQLLRLLAGLMGNAPRLAAQLSRRAQVLDAVLSEDFLRPAPLPAELAAGLAGGLRLARDHQDRLDVLRRFANERRFQIGVQLLHGAADAEAAGRAYADLADVCLAALLPVVGQDFARAHGHVPGGEIAVVALGKLGGQEMTVASDLDLILVYDYPGDEAQSDGPRPLPASTYYARLCQRFINAITAPTGEGQLYDVDMRLRPSGGQGPVAVRLSRLIDYHAQEAWTWEHMALTRARVVAGEVRLADKVAAAIHAVLTRPREPGPLALDVADMRQRIAKEKGSADPWELKQVRGGLVDLEFIAQFLQLRHAARQPEVLDRNTAGAYRKLAEAGALAPAVAQELLAAHRLVGNLMALLRVAIEGQFQPASAPEGLRAALVRAGGAADFAALQQRLEASEALVYRRFRELVEAAVVP